MIAVTFIARDDTQRTVSAAEGDTLLAVAQAADQPLEGTCEGQMACATCHVIITPGHFDRLPPPARTRKTCWTSPRAQPAPAGWPVRSS